MIPRRSFHVVIAFAAVSSPGCTGTDVGNGYVDVDFALYDSSESSARSKSVSLAAPEGIVIAEAWVAVERLRLRDAADCDGNSESEFIGPYAVDMLSPGVAADLAQLEVSFIDYCRFEMRWDVFDSAIADSPAELLGASILVSGERGDGTPFVVRSERGDEVRLDARDLGFAINARTGALFVAFDVQDLFDAIPLDSADVGDDGAIRIEEGSNEDLLSTFDDNVAQSAKLFDDNDDDKELDPEERDDTDILAE